MRPQLEVLHQPSLIPSTAPPVLFVHGAFAGAWCWQPVMTDLAAAGFDTYALSLRGHGSSPEFEHLNRYCVDDFVADLRSVVKTLPVAPILVGHSMGGFVVQRYLGKGPVAAVALLASVPPYGLAGSACYLAALNPKLLWLLNCFQLGGSRDVALGDVRDLLFSPAMPDEELKSFISQAQAESLQALWDMSLPQPWRLWSLPKVPALVLGAALDRIIPQSDIEVTAHALGVEAQILPDVGHAMMLDAGRQRVAAALIDWLRTEPWQA